MELSGLSKPPSNPNLLVILIPKLQLPHLVEPLFKPARWKVLYGGRCSGKSWSVARILLAKALESRIKVLCAREFQESLSRSVYDLLRSQIVELGLSSRYTVGRDKITSDIGSEFTFAGLRHNVQSLKSAEGIDICWIEEGQTIGRESLETLVPTIRKAGSEIWVTMNPHLESDALYERFIAPGASPGEDAIVVRMGWEDNPWLTKEMLNEKDSLLARDPDSYHHVWGGYCRRYTEGAVYAAELRLAEEEARITKVPYVEGTPVHRAWDLGHHDSTAIWCIQRVGFEYRAIDYIEGRQQKLVDYLKNLASRSYLWGNDYVPHDAVNQSLTGKSVEQSLKEAGCRPVIVPRSSASSRIDSLRTMFANMWFDSEKCAEGIRALRNYRYEVDREGHGSREPVHDWSSHAADALGCFAAGFQARSAPRTEVRRDYVSRDWGSTPSTTGWMAA